MSTKPQALAAVKQNGLALKDFQEWNDDWGVVMVAILQNGMALEFASLSMRGDEVIVKTAVRRNPMAADFAFEVRKSEPPPAPAEPRRLKGRGWL